MSTLEHADHAGIDEAYANLDKHTVSLAEYERKVKEGVLAEYRLSDSDPEFSDMHPDHPLASPNRKLRIRSADMILQSAIEDAAEVSSRGFDILHKALFDCCPAVRVTVAHTLGLLSGKESIPVLEQLVQDEKDPSIKATAIEALRVIDGVVSVDEGPIIRREQVFAIPEWYVSYLTEGKVSTRQSPITLLEKEVWSACVRQKPAEGTGQAERWQNDELAHLREGFTILPLPEYLSPLVQAALDEWGSHESRILARIGMSRQQYLEEFGQLHGLYQAGRGGWQMKLLKMAVSGVVPDMDWVNLFSWILPRAIPHRSDDLGQTGRMVAALFYAQILQDHMGGKDGEESDVLRRMEARWILANEKGDKTQAMSGSQETAIQVDRIRKSFWEAVRKTINKFREHPCYFFTESDIVSYFYSCFYSSGFECLNDENKRIYLAHREYPTNFRYDKKKLIDDSFKPYPLNGKEGSRGNYDFAVLNPDFVKNARTVEDVVNKNIQLLLKRTGNSAGRNYGKELLFTVEFKYIINNSKNFVDEVSKDNRKLEISEKDQSELGVNLVFCNVKPHCEDIYDEVRTSKVITLFINSYYQDGNHKISPRPVANQKLKDYIQAHPSLFAKAFWKSFLK